MCKRLPALLATMIAGAVLAPGAQAAQRPRWHPCRDAPERARCGSVTRPAGPRGSPAGRAHPDRVRALRRRDRGRPSLGTMVDVEGGPGYSTTDSRAYYLALAGPLMARRDLLLVDARGTGLVRRRSTARRCAARSPTTSAGRAAARASSAPRRDFYGTHAAVDDLADVLDALRIAQVDLYGDSYGSYVAQAFAVRHRDRLRSLVLDATYPLPGTDPAFGDLAEATWRGAARSCASGGRAAPRAARTRAPRCSGWSSGSARGRCAAWAATPRASASAVTGRRRRAGRRSCSRPTAACRSTATCSAAIRAFEAGDRAPLLRLVAETKLDPTASPVRGFSEPLYLAVTCHDYPQLWDPAAPLAERRGAARVRAQAALPPERFAPFTRDRVDVADVRGRDGVPALARPARADPPVPPGRAVSRRADAGAQRRPRQHHRLLGRAGRRLALPALDVRGDAQHDPRLRARRPRRLRRADRAALRRARSTPATRAAPARIAEVRTVDAFPRRPRRRRRGPRRATQHRRARRVAAVAAATVADAIQRWPINYSGTSRGLRGGRWSYTRRRSRRASASGGARFARDVPVTGTRDLADRDRRGPRRPAGPRRGRVRRALERAAASWRGRRSTGRLGGRRAAGDDARALRRRACGSVPRRSTHPLRPAQATPGACYPSTRLPQDAPQLERLCACAGNTSVM